jgi:hypothetical protein
MTSVPDGHRFASTVHDMSDFHDPTHSSEEITADAGPCRPVAAGSRLDAWAAATWTGGLQIDQQAALEALTVCTRNSTYTIVVLRPATGDVLVRGGRLFPTFERAVLVGATAGGSVIKVRGIYRGLRMEIAIRGQRVLTSPVASIAPAPQASAAGAV